tara:strand:- start:129 stop:584 length:456 start_codon:yes stop_codon:yes gene_type:complete
MIDDQLIIDLIIPGKPRAKERPRFVYRKGKTITYTPKSTLDFELLIANQIRLKASTLYAGPAKLKLLIVHPRPKSRPAYIPSSEWKNGVRCWRPARPDGDNVLKLIMDSITKSRIINDDAQIVFVEWISLTAAKDENPFMQFQLKKLNWAE